jgi:hypothetical protein
MRKLFGWLSLALLAAGCGANGLPMSPSSRSAATGVSGLHSLEVAGGDWSPWFFRSWVPGIGAPLGPNATIDGVVEGNDVCVSNLRSVWDARSSCSRFLVTVPSEGRLQAFLRWDASAPAFDESLAGEVVLVAADGRFASSDWQRAEVDVGARVQPGNYTVLVITYVPLSMPFQLRTEFLTQ